MSSRKGGSRKDTRSLTPPGFPQTDDGKPSRWPLVNDELADQLVGKAKAEGVELLGPSGLLSQVTKTVLDAPWLRR
jgi:hypothetical protein